MKRLFVIASMILGFTVITLTVSAQAKASDDKSTQVQTRQSAQTVKGNFVDKNNDGICDHRQVKGKCDNCTSFVDQNGDGKCDNCTGGNCNKSNCCAKGEQKDNCCGMGPGKGCGKQNGKGNGTCRQVKTDQTEKK